MKIEVLFMVAFTMCCKASETHKGPAYSAILLKNNVTLECRDDSVLDKKPVWKFNSAGGSKIPKTIYINGRIMNGDPRFSVDDGIDTHYDLMIKNTDKTDAGSYSCLTSAGNYVAQLVILASNPICEKRQFGSGATNESFEVELKCSVQFWGSWPPTFRWHIVNGSDLDASNVQSTNDTVMSSVIVFVNSTHNDDLVVQCTTYFADRSIGHVTEVAKNVPRYQYVWTSRISSGREVHESDTTTYDQKQSFSDDGPECRQITTESVGPDEIPTQIDDQRGNEENENSNVAITGAVAIFERNEPVRGVGICQPTINGPETLYENTFGEAYYINMDPVQPSEPDQEHIPKHYLSLEAATKETSRIPSIYRRLIGQKSRHHQPLQAESESPIYVNTIGH